MKTRVRRVAFVSTADHGVEVDYRRRATPGPVVSAAAHLLAGALLVLAPLRPIQPPPPPRAIEVEIVSPSEFAIATSVVAPPAAVPARPLEPAPVRVPSPTAVPDASPGLVVANRLYSADLLEQPDMERVRTALRTYADADRIAQLCNIEGVEQIRRFAPQFDPDVIVPYAMTDMHFDGLTLVADGAAFRSRRQWYELTFSCTAMSDYRGVEAFSFRLGGLIPLREWEAHNLNASDENEPE